MRVHLWGARGSLPSFGPENARYGGNTTCVAVTADDGTMVVLDAGTGIRRLGAQVGRRHDRVDVLLTHLHMDHVQGLGFFEPLFEPGLELHVWGPSSVGSRFEERLTRYLSPPLFPVRLREVPAELHCHDVPRGTFEIGPFRVTADFVCHPGPTVGYRLEQGGRSFAFLPDHEPILGRPELDDPAWVSGYDLAQGVDLLCHDSQYDDHEYSRRVGWGHSTVRHALRFADLVGARRLVAFHHDPSHDDSTIDRLIDRAVAVARPACDVLPGHEGDTIEVRRGS